jgi:hypothetical protein
VGALDQLGGVPADGERFDVAAGCPVLTQVAASCDLRAVAVEQRPGGDELVGVLGAGERPPHAPAVRAVVGAVEVQTGGGDRVRTRTGGGPHPVPVRPA